MAIQVDIGDVVRCSVVFTNTAGTAADPTAISFMLKKTSGGSTTTHTTTGTPPLVVKDSTGNYHIDIPADVRGTYYWRWIGTGAVAAASEGTFYVSISAF